MRILAFDPGDTTGVAIVSSQVTDEGPRASFEMMTQMTLNELIQWTATFNEEVDLIIYERFIVFRQKAKQQTGSKMQVSQAIGVIKALAARLQVPIVEQGPDIKRPALAWSGITMPGVHAQTHKVDAALHAFFYLYTKGLIKNPRKGLLENG